MLWIVISSIGSFIIPPLKKIVVIEIPCSTSHSLRVCSNARQAEAFGIPYPLSSTSTMAPFAPPVSPGSFPVGNTAATRQYFYPKCHSQAIRSFPGFASIIQIQTDVQTNFHDRTSFTDQNFLNKLERMRN